MHIEKLPSGSFRAIVKVNGGEAKVTRKTRGEAHQAGAELAIALGATIVGGHDVTVADMVHGHLLGEAIEKWSPTTHADLTRIARKLPEVFMAREVSSVTPAVLHALYRQLKKEGWSPHRVQKAHTLLSICWGDAVLYEWARSNPCRDIKPPTPPTARVNAPTHAQVRAILAAADGLFRLYLAVAVCTGARRSEVVALRWADVDVARGSVTITHSIVQTTGQPVIERNTKTGDKGHRKLSLDHEVAESLGRWRAAQVELALANGLPSPVWVFSMDAGVTPWRPDYVTQTFGRARRDAGVAAKGVRLHDLRHYVITTMLEDGIQDIKVSAQAGHASLRMLDKYATYRDAPGRDSADHRAARLSEDG